MIPYLVIAAVYAAFGIKKGNPPHIAIGLGLIWPLFLLMGLLGHVRTKNKPQSLNECRQEIVLNIQSIRHMAGAKTKSHGDSWSVLLADTSISLAAIKQFPNDVPIIAAALMRVVGSLDALARTADPDLSVLYRETQETLAKNTDHATTKLIELHGSKVTDSEYLVASDLINSFKWDKERQEFVLERRELLPANTQAIADKAG